jgi:thiosulfate/3-mercaptopyruvate sulfurtransferase
MRLLTSLHLPALLGSALVLTVFVASPPRAATNPAAPHPAAVAPAARPDSVTEADLIHTPELSPLLALPANQRPVLLQVGFEGFYRTAHIAGSRYAGPASKPEGLRALRLALKPLPRDRQVVLYCGCCPWSDCPNVRPAFRVARKMGFKNVRVLYIAKNLREDALDQGLPEEREPQ